MIYLDAAATAKYNNIDDIIVNTMVTAMRDSWINPSSLYAANVRDKINKCRANVAEFIGAKPEEIYFTSGASESNNWAIKGWVDRWLLDGYKIINVITTHIEHKSILETVNHLGSNVAVEYCNVDQHGFVKCEHLEVMLDAYHNNKAPILVSIGMANNEIGAIQQIRKIADLVHKYDGILHVDATQAFGHIPIDVKTLDVDMMSCSGHKVSPVLRGIGFLYKKNGIDIQPLIYGAQENGMRGGTENTYGIIGLAKALEYCDMTSKTARALIGKRDYFIGYLKHEFGCKLNGHNIYRLPNNINVTFPQNITAESLLYTLDMSDIQISVGSACDSKSYQPSRVLKAIGLTDEEAMRSVRFTLPNDITYKEIDMAIDEIGKAIKIIETN
jgi:cysteine desulfurase